jgi:hypothetical protein
MTDTPQHIKDLQLKMWLSKTPEERLLLALKTNEEMYLFGLQAREAMKRIESERQPKK